MDETFEPVATDDRRDQDDTRERLLDEAETLFAARGFNGVSVREISRAAKANIAAISYHFGSKKALYKEVFRQRWLERSRRVRRPLYQLEARESFTAEEVVRTLARTFLNFKGVDFDRLKHAQLAMREMVQPSEVHQLLIERHWRPTVDLLVRLFERALPSPPDRERLALSVISLLGMVIFHVNTRLAVKALLEIDDQDELDRIIQDQITRFALRGLGAEE